MIYVTLGSVKGKKACPEGPLIYQAFASEYGDDEPISIEDVLNRYDLPVAMYCLRAGHTGKIFAICFTLKCIIESGVEPDGGFSILVDLVERIKDNAYTYLSSGDCESVCAICASARINAEKLNCFLERNSYPANTVSICLAWAKLGYALYSQMISSTSVGYCIGACEDARWATGKPEQEMLDQSELFRQMLRKSQDDVMDGKK